MAYDRVIQRTSFRLEYSEDSLTVKSISAQSINCLCWKNYELTIVSNIGSNGSQCWRPSLIVLVRPIWAQRSSNELWGYHGGTAMGQSHSYRSRIGWRVNWNLWKPPSINQEKKWIVSTFVKSESPHSIDSIYKILESHITVRLVYDYSDRVHGL